MAESASSDILSLQQVTATAARVPLRWLCGEDLEADASLP
jgi:hypothetical protein